MKTLRKYLNPLAKANAFIFGLFILVSCNTTASAEPTGISSTTDKKKIQIALLLDTSNSMDGLIEQTKSQLWKLVNTIADAQYEDEEPELELALFEYGNDGLNEESGYIRQVQAFTGSLDDISEKLFSLRTWGGSEYCGFAIKTSLEQLKWSPSDKDLKIIFIAGNEPFNQGPESFQSSCKKAISKDVIVNTIFCGNRGEGLRSGWKQGADLAKGEFSNIEQNTQTVYYSTPYDYEINSLNDSLNDTYVYYGTSGYRMKEKQTMQDYNAKQYGTANSVTRSISKTKKVYKNEKWDLVDATTSDSTFAISKIKTSQLPKEMQNMTNEEKEVYVKEKSEKRNCIKTRITQLNKLRLANIEEQKQAGNEQKDNPLETALIEVIKKQAISKGFTFPS